jgi:enoyl-CoA hydratase/carnithine racemase
MQSNGPEGSVLVEWDDRVCTLTLNRPQRRNALDDGAIDAFVATAKEIASRNPAAVILRGAGDGAFCAGYDLAGIDPAADHGRPLPDERFARVIRALEAIGCPTVAAMTGDAFGGGLDLACACDFRVAAPEVRLAMTPARLGLVYHREGVSRIAARLGPALARRLFLLAAPVTAEEAHRLGGIDLLVGRPKVFEAGRELAATIARNAPLAVRGTLAALRFAERATPPTDAETADLERRRLEAWTSEDLREGLAAFANKRNPAFRGR